MLKAGRVVGLLTCGAALVGVLPALLAGALAAGAAPSPALAAGDGGPGPLASEEAIADIPAAALSVYRAAAGWCAGLAWPVLAAIGKLESDHGRFGGARLDPATLNIAPPIVGIALDGREGVAGIRTPSAGSQWHGDPVWDHAVGPMQFITSTWAAWAVDGSGDGRADPHNLADAAATAARYLCAGDPALHDVEAAILRYNASGSYLGAVLDWAARYQGPPAPPGITIHAPGVVLPDPALGDIASGAVDARVVALLETMGRSYQIEVSVLVSGHSQCVGGGDQPSHPGCSVSNHWQGRAMDIAAVDGTAVTAGNLGARRLVEQLLALPAEQRPTEIGGPWGDLAGVFTDGGHQDHLHIGWDA